MAGTKVRCSCCKEQLLESFPVEARNLSGGYSTILVYGCRRCDVPKCVACDKPIGELMKPGNAEPFKRCEHCGRRDPLVPDKVA